MYAIYGKISHQYTPFMLVYIPAPWIRHGIVKGQFRQGSVGPPWPGSQVNRSISQKILGKKVIRLTISPWNFKDV